MTSNGRRRLEGEIVSGLERELSARVDGYIEYDGSYRPLGPTHRINVGLSYRRHPSQQVDFLVGAGVTRGTLEIAVGAGFSFRVGKRSGSAHP